MSDKKRPYRLKKRAILEAETRRRITESAVILHGTLGPSRTSISALAEHAGVRRSTVYRHFPDEAALFAACTAHWMADNPYPDPAAWAAIEDPDTRLEIALRALYVHYRRTQQMMGNILRDETTMPMVARMLGGYRHYLAVARDTLMIGRTGTGAPAARAAIGHALAFHTWRSLAIEQGLDDGRCVRLMALLVAASDAETDR